MCSISPTHLNHLPQKEKLKMWRKFFKNPLTNPLKCDIIKAQKRERQQNKPTKKNQKKFKKGLDKPLKMWYNKGTEGKEKPSE